MAETGPGPGPRSGGTARRRAGASLTARVAAAVAVLLTIGGLFVAIAALAYGRQAARETYDRLLLGAANAIAAAVTVQGGALEIDLPVDAFELLALAPDDRVAYRVLGPDGETLTGMDSAPLPPPVQPRASTGPNFYDAAFTDAPARFVIVSRRFAERDFSGTVRVVVGQTLEARQALAHDISSRALLVLVVFGGGMVLIAAFVVRQAMRPLDEAGAALRARDPYDLTPIPLPRPREAAEMVASVNGLMARLERQMAEMRNLISDTAHQLRTPVAALRAQADLAAEETDLERRARIVARIHRRAVGLGRLLDQMLSRAMVIHRSGAVRREVVDLRDVALEVLEQSDHDLLPGAPAVALEVGDRPVPVRADLLSLVEAVKNLLNNALAHGRPPVRLGAGVVAGEAVIWVRDAGQGPPAEVLAARGGRFARGTGGEGGGSGLGLSIAHAVAVAFDGRLEEACDAQGFRIALALPLVAAAVPGEGEGDAA